MKIINYESDNLYLINIKYKKNFLKKFIFFNNEKILNNQIEFFKNIFFIDSYDKYKTINFSEYKEIYLFNLTIEYFLNFININLFFFD